MAHSKSDNQDKTRGENPALPDTDRKSKVPQREDETDESGDALNDAGEDNQHRKHRESDQNEGVGSGSTLFDGACKSSRSDFASFTKPEFPSCTLSTRQTLAKLLLKADLLHPAVMCAEVQVQKKRSNHALVFPATAQRVPIANRLNSILTRADS